MKKIFLAGAVALSLVALAATPSRQTSKENSFDMAYYQDTIPGKKKDTTQKPIPDSLASFKLVANK